LTDGQQFQQYQQSKQNPHLRTEQDRLRQTLKWPKEKDKWNMSIDICHIDIPKRLTSPEHKKSMIHGVGRPGSNLGHAQKSDKVKPIHGIPFPSDN
jgi:hypothetical protein